MSIVDAKDRVGGVPKTCEEVENVDHIYHIHPYPYHDICGIECMWATKIQKWKYVGAGATKCCHIC
jgi:hypothetical protein